MARSKRQRDRTAVAVPPLGLCHSGAVTGCAARKLALAGSLLRQRPALKPFVSNFGCADALPRAGFEVASLPSIGAGSRADGPPMPGGKKRALGATVSSR